ncbi:MAG: transaldolase [Pseudanabaenaceae cyanobacterium SKYGB_i_bin29]|nr:transaldolase [Pseudanabaenaceae cyanobacterium SKYG29]MDW8422583.1 transaldolase [Pseudanabaenaceae cyanobacterium SKYGB_i_bin29]
MAKNHLLEIEEHGQSVWMDNLSRNIIQSGALADMVQNQGIRGITSNPAIFQKAIAGNAIYDDAILAAIKAGKTVTEIYETLAFQDIRDAADILRPVYEATNGKDGYVSIEVSPHLAHDTEGTIAEAVRFWQTIDRPNVMIKIPGTAAGLKATTEVIATGVPVNVTLLFSVKDYEETALAYMAGLEKRVEKGEPIDRIASVASFFLSRIDTKIDAMLDKLTNVDPQKIQSLKGKAAIANAKMAYQKYKQLYATDRWQALKAKGAQEQRLLWASTSTKNPAYSDVMYVDNLVGENTVNTMPPETIAACIDHCDVETRIEMGLDEAQKVLQELTDLGINLDQVMYELQVEGIDKFVQPFTSLMNSLTEKVNQLQVAA